MRKTAYLLFGTLFIISLLFTSCGLFSDTTEYKLEIPEMFLNKTYTGTAVANGGTSGFDNTSIPTTITTGNDSTRGDYISASYYTSQTNQEELIEVSDSFLKENSGKATVSINSSYASRYQMTYTLNQTDKTVLTLSLTNNEANFTYSVDYGNVQDLTVSGTLTAQ